MMDTNTLNTKVHWHLWAVVQHGSATHPRDIGDTKMSCAANTPVLAKAPALHTDFAKISERQQ